MVLTGIITVGCVRLTEVPLAIPLLFGFGYISIFFLYSTFLDFFVFLSIVPLCGRVNSVVPEGLEASASNTVRALLALGEGISSMLSIGEMKAFGIKGGYYERTKTPVAINLGYVVAILSISILFLRKPRKLKANANQSGMRE